MSSSANPHLVRLGFQRASKPSSPAATRSPIYSAAAFRSASHVMSSRFGVVRWRCGPRHYFLPISAMDEDSMGIPSLFEEGDDISGGYSSYMLSSSEGEDSDIDLLLNPTGDIDLPTSRDHLETPDAAMTVAAHRFATMHKGRRKKRTLLGVMITMGLIAFLISFLLFIDWCSWKIVRLPLESFYFTHPFSLSAVLSACAGCLYVPIAESMKIRLIRRRERPMTYFHKSATPTMGGLFFLPIGIVVARGIAGLNSTPVNGVVVATVACAVIGLLDDTLSWIKNPNYGLPQWLQFFLQVAVGTWFSIWLDSANISTPYSMKLLVPLPPPHGLVCMEKFYIVLTACSFVAMGSGVKSIDGLDGLAGGVAALAFIGMSVAVLPICPKLSIFGVSMAGACIGFLFHNRYKATVYMGRIGSLALGGALAAIAACTGMFFPLLISSGVFILELLSVIVQVLFMMATRHMYGTTRRFFRMASLHHCLKLFGLKEPLIVASAYIISSILALFAGYVGLISA
ncbi:phospho-N-acetylmuramoyl-pentapeptide-transferase homolog isoform X1 [Elaeis guineensis]|uniref:Phospho-N-acetylmuramoyl-pentapeptide- transferase homolog isoform X1 n=1 Tax=Elaeis guineensis var. tenera TaxID=51953 RepID=A0A6I9QUM2_ELAGV|nr:phospho-N-acetylmuramoyl-pentapeptide-transferase homolog isoform X1 [Elaeis guineensis]